MENTYEVSTSTPVGNDKIFAVLSYLGLWEISLISNPEKEHEYVRNHMKNGIIIDILALICAIIPFVGWIADIALLVVAIIGIVKACKGEMYELPVVGKMFPTLNTEKVVSVMSYISCGWVLGLIAYPEKESPLVNAHANNGLILTIGIIIGAIVPVLGWIFDIVCLVFAIIGIVKACKGVEYRIPLFANKQIIK